jgi:hypothetical protein
MYRYLYYTLDILTVLFCHWRPVNNPAVFHSSYFKLYWACAQLFSPGQSHFFSRSGRAYCAHSTAETVNSEVFQNANGLVECKEGQWWCQQNKSECVLFQLRLSRCNKQFITLVVEYGETFHLWAIFSLACGSWKYWCTLMKCLAIFHSDSCNKYIPLHPGEISEWGSTPHMVTHSTGTWIMLIPRSQRSKKMLLRARCRI